MATELYTIGYEGLSISEFVGLLKRHSIACLIDVRELPVSRKAGFSKTPLSNWLLKSNIQYCHIKELGSPGEVRHKLKEDLDYSSFFEKMERYLSTKISAIQTAHKYIKQRRCCLMCFENTANKCHRSIVAKKIKDYDGNGLSISHI